MKIIKLTSVYIFLCLLIAGQSAWASSDKTEYLSIEEEISKFEKSDARYIEILEEETRRFNGEELEEEWDEELFDETAGKKDEEEEPTFVLPNCGKYGFYETKSKFNISYEKLGEKEYTIELLKQAQAHNDVLLKKFKAKNTPIQELINYYISNGYPAASESDKKSTLFSKESFFDLINIIIDVKRMIGLESEYEPEAEEDVVWAWALEEEDGSNTPHKLTPEEEKIEEYNRNKCQFLNTASQYLERYQQDDYKEKKFYIIEKILKDKITTNNNKTEFCASGNEKKCKESYKAITTEKQQKAIEAGDDMPFYTDNDEITRKQTITCKENFVKATGDCQHDYTYFEEEKDDYNKNTLEISCKSFKNGKCQGGGEITISEPACRCGNAYTTIILAKNKNNGWGYIVIKSKPHELTQKTFCFDYDIALNKCKQAKANERINEFGVDGSPVPPVKTCTVKGDECYNDDGTKSNLKPVLSLNPDYLKYFALD